MTTLDRLFSLIEAEGTNQSTVERELGLSNSSFSDWKRGKGKPSIDALIKFSKRFDVSIDWLVSGEEHRSSNTVTFTDPTERQLIDRFRQLPDSNKQTVIAYIDGILAALGADDVTTEQEASLSKSIS